ncbi:MAG: AAC(3) family N-acetyltransferase [Candidatus Latescibacterota bacterium]
MSLTATDLEQQFRAAGLDKGQTIMLHSSLSSLGHVAGGAETVVSSLLRVLGPEGTLCVPNLVFRGSMTQFLRAHTRIDLCAMPSRNGTLTEAVRNHPLARQSVHPSHPVSAIGRRRDELLRDHLCSRGPCGPESPWGKIAATEGRIVLLDVDHACNTTLHVMEETTAPYIFLDEALEGIVIDRSGREHPYRVQAYVTDRARTFGVVDAPLSEEGIQQMASVGAATVRIIDSPRMFTFCVAAVRKNPDWLAGKNRSEESP